MTIFGKLKKAYKDDRLVGKAYMDAHREVAEVYYKNMKDNCIKADTQELMEDSLNRLKGIKSKAKTELNNSWEGWK